MKNEELKCLTLKNVGGKIRQCRVSKGLTQMQLAELTGIDRADIGKIERGVMNISLATLANILNALGLSIEIKKIEN